MFDMIKYDRDDLVLYYSAGEERPIARCAIAVGHLPPDIYRPPPSVAYGLWSRVPPPSQQQRQRRDGSNCMLGSYLQTTIRMSGILGPSHAKFSCVDKPYPPRDPASSPKGIEPARQYLAIIATTCVFSMRSNRPAAYMLPSVSKIHRCWWYSSSGFDTATRCTVGAIPFWRRCRCPTNTSLLMKIAPGNVRC